MIYADKDPTFETLFLQEALKARGCYSGELDNWRGPQTDAALAAARVQVQAELGTTSRHINERGLALIKAFEGLHLQAYKDAVGIWTIGWGHTGIVHQDGSVHEGRTITEEQAEELLKYDLRNFERAVARLVTVPLDDDQFAALVSFAFNLGEGNLQKSTLLKKLNAGDYASAAEEFGKWNQAGGQVLAGLVRRRESEQRLFLGEPDPIVSA